MNEPLHPSQQSQYAALQESAGFGDLPGRTQLEMSGKDAVALLHNLCTNDIKRLQPGDGCEAFLANIQGKVLGHVLVFRGTDSLILDTSPDQAAALEQHLDRYVIREDVQFHDRSREWGELLIAGPRASAVLREVCGQDPPETWMQHGERRIADVPVFVRRTDWAGPACWFVAGPAEQLPAVAAGLADAGAVACESDVVEIARVERGSPLYGRDITPENLPQEVGRDSQAISFQKGCYLGQETVARIDALGHVNWKLMGLQGPGLPAAGQPLLVGDKVVARLTSRVISPRFEAPLALAYVRRGQEAAGTRLAAEGGPVVVVALPVTP
jgi:folate-binding protein YgfZ